MIGKIDEYMQNIMMTAMNSNVAKAEDLFEHTTASTLPEDIWVITWTYRLVVYIAY